jgi:hypothetical protein
MIRQAEVRDIKQIVALYKEGLDELGYTDSKEDLLINKVTESFVLAPCFVIEKDGILEGIAGLTLVITSHNGVAQLVDYMFYIKPGVRNIKTLNALVLKVKEFASANNLPLKLEFLCNDDEPLKKRLLTMNGFKIGGIIGVYNV